MRAVLVVPSGSDGRMLRGLLDYCDSAGLEVVSVAQSGEAALAVLAAGAADVVVAFRPEDLPQVHVVEADGQRRGPATPRPVEAAERPSAVPRQRLVPGKAQARKGVRATRVRCPVCDSTDHGEDGGLVHVDGCTYEAERELERELERASQRRDTTRRAEREPGPDTA